MWTWEWGRKRGAATPQPRPCERAPKVRRNATFTRLAPKVRKWRITAADQRQKKPLGYLDENEQQDKGAKPARIFKENAGPE